MKQAQAIEVMTRAAGNGYADYTEIRVVAQYWTTYYRSLESQLFTVSVMAGKCLDYPRDSQTWDYIRWRATRIATQAGKAYNALEPHGEINEWRPLMLLYRDVRDKANNIKAALW